MLIFIEPLVLRDALATLGESTIYNEPDVCKAGDEGLV